MSMSSILCHHLIVRDVQSNDVVGTYRNARAQARSIWVSTPKSSSIYRDKNLMASCLN
jgi:hypothetical protein